MNLAILSFSGGKLDEASTSFTKAHDVYLKLTILIEPQEHL